MIAIKWGMICSVSDSATMSKLGAFGEWLVDKLTKHAQQFNLSIQFKNLPNFLMQCKPDDAESIYATYERVYREYSDVFYVLHILPKKDSLEFKLFKDITINYAIIGQGVLIDRALTKFADLDLDDICKNMNQYISRRLSQTVCYKRDENTYRLIINGKNPILKKNINLDGDISTCVEMALHSDKLQNKEFTVTIKSILENQVELKGFPKSFNKFQVASLFSDFRPLFVQICSDSTALVEFENKFHTIQVALNYNQRIIENFVLLVKAKCEAIQMRVKTIAKHRLQQSFPPIDQLIVAFEKIKQEN